jgi:hypothetical protein
MILGRRRLPPSSYHDYLESPAWGMRSAQFRFGTDRGGRCAACGTVRFLEAHHWTYRRLGHERNSDLVSFCFAHHARVHQLARLLTGRRSGTLWLVTPAVVLAGRLLYTRPGRITLGMGFLTLCWLALRTISG